METSAVGPGAIEVHFFQTAGAQGKVDTATKHCDVHLFYTQKIVLLDSQSAALRTRVLTFEFVCASAALLSFPPSHGSSLRLECAEYLVSPSRLGVEVPLLVGPLQRLSACFSIYLDAVYTARCRGVGPTILCALDSERERFPHARSCGYKRTRLPSCAEFAFE